jgi:hypothetical protein
MSYTEHVRFNTQGQTRALPLFPARGKPKAYTPAKVPAPKCSKFTLLSPTTSGLRTLRLAMVALSRRRETGQADGCEAEGNGDVARLIHALELKRRGETMSEEQEAFAAWCTEKGVPHACVDDLRDALAVLSGWGVLRNRIIG